MGKLKHWTANNTGAFVHRIASDFVAQLENKLQKDGSNHAELASRLGVTPGRVSQVLNTPGNLTLRNIVQYVRALGLKVAIVAYDDGDPQNHNGPVNSEIFAACWKNAGSPANFFELSQFTISKHFDYSGFAATNGQDRRHLVLKQTAFNRPLAN
jgi:DNA-binding phage protein